MQDIFQVLHVFICAGLIGLVLIQHGKGADMGAGFGAGASGTLFGARGSGNFLTRSTAILATAFFLNSTVLAYFTLQQAKPSASVIQSIPTAPVAPITDVPTPSVPPAVPTPAEPQAAAQTVTPAAQVSTEEVKPAQSPAPVPLQPATPEPPTVPTPVPADSSTQ